MLLISALLVLGFAVLLLVYYFSVPGGSAPSPDNTAVDQSPTVEPFPSSNLGSSGGSVEPGPPFSTMAQKDIDDSQPGENTAIPSTSRLQEAELEHLSDVFLNSLYPSFQYGFHLNRESRAAIDVFVASMPEGLNNEDLDRISAMIKAQLPTPEAEELAFIITHLYRLEQEEARIMSEGAPITTMADQLAAQERLSQLRDQWFGPELSALLFSEADDVQAGPDQSTAGNRPDGNGTEDLPEPLAEEQAELADIESAWEQRYQRFLAEKQIIDQAGLDQIEKDKQIEALLRQHYTPQELEAARAYDQSRK